MVKRYQQFLTNTRKINATELKRKSMRNQEIFEKDLNNLHLGLEQNDKDKEKERKSEKGL